MSGWEKLMRKVVFSAKTKFYTDLWHVLLGRHKIDDSNGEYPDYFVRRRTYWKTNKDTYDCS